MLCIYLPAKNTSLKEIKQVVKIYLCSVFALNVAYKLKRSRSKLVGSLIESGQGKICRWSTIENILLGPMCVCVACRLHFW